MIDLSALGLIATKTSHHTGKQGGGHGHGNTDDATSFDDLIGAAAKKAGHKGNGHHADNEAADNEKSLVNPKLPKIDLRTAVIGASAGNGKDAGDQAAGGKQTQASLPDSLQQLVKSKSENAAADDLHDIADLADDADQADDKTTNTAKDTTKSATSNKVVAPRASDAKAHSDPAQELRAMLEPAQDAKGEEPVKNSADVGHDHKDKADSRADDVADASAKDLKTEISADPGPAIPKADTAVVAQAATHQAAAMQNVATDDNDTETQSSGDARKIQAVLPDDKVRVSDVGLSEDNDAASTKSASGDKSDFVTVLESRRYLGFSGDASVGGNTNALSEAIKADPTLNQLVQDAKASGTQHATSTEVNTLKLQMSPEHLGNMTASLRLKGDELSVEVRVETADAYRQLTQDHDGLVKALKEHGFSIDQVSIQLAPSARADSGQTGGNQSQSGSGQQSLQDGSQGDTARQRDDGARRNANQNNWTGNERTASFSDTGNGTDDTRSGNLYL